MRYSLFHLKVCYFFRLPRCCTSPENVGLFLRNTLIRQLDIAQHLSMVGGDDTGVDVRARAEVVEDTGANGIFDELEGLLTLGDR